MPPKQEFRLNIIKKLRIAPIDEQKEDEWINEAIEISNTKPKMKINEIHEYSKKLLRNMNNLVKHRYMARESYSKSILSRNQVKLEQGRKSNMFKTIVP